MPRISLTQTAHTVIQQHLQADDTAIDATVGNGHDTLFLARLTGPNGCVYGFDIQPPALTSARSRLKQHRLDGCVTLINDSHAHIDRLVPKTQHGKVKAVMFNLGYLPGSDKTVITQSASTLAALNAALQILAPEGVITILAYPGHSGGDEETSGVQTWCERLDPLHHTVSVLHGEAHKNTSPRLCVIQLLK
jgi:16S rRNA C1402 N4-methylase RsmH